MHEAKYTCMAALDDPPQATNTAWLNDASADPYASAGQKFRDYLASAWNSATVAGRVSTSISGALAAVFGPPPDPNAQNDYTAYPVEQARWLKGQYHTGSSLLFQTWYNYADPKPFADMRLRGARQYCAAMKAQMQQGGSSRSMGQVDALSANIMGIPVKFLSVEPMMSIAIPPDYVFPGKGMVDGAQAFAIPLMFGNRVRIGSNLGIPGAGEMRYPFTIITGDSEVVNNADVRMINGKWQFGKRYQTVTHADAFNSPTGYTSVARVIPLPPISILQINLNLGLDIAYGSSAFADDSRVLSRTGWLWSTTPAPSAGIAFHSGGWSYNPARLWNISPTSDKWVVPWTDGGPLTTNRVWENNDHHRTPFMMFRLTGGVTGEIGGRLGPLHVGLGAGGYIDGTVHQIHDVRDGLGARGPVVYSDVGNKAIPTAEVVVRPRTRSEASLDLKVHLKIVAEFGWFDVKIIDRDLINASVPISDWDTDDKHTTYDERSNLRLGYGADSSSLVAPDTRSHLPGAVAYPTFDSNFTVDTCLASTPPAPPEQCTGTPAESTPPGRQVCLYMPFGKISGNPCADPEAWELAHNSGWVNDAQRACRVEFWRYLCSDLSKGPQWWAGQNAISHKLPYNTADDPNNPDGIWLDNVVHQCEDAYVPADANEPTNAQAWADSFFRWAICADDATLLSPFDQGVSSVGDATQAPAADYNTPTCH